MDMRGLMRISIGVVPLLIGGISMASATAYELGETVSASDAISAQVSQAHQTYDVIERRVGSDRIQAFVNDEQQVFAITITSEAMQAPDPRDYLGQYADYEPETVRVSPLRSRVVRYTHEGQMAEWRLSGMSGRFSAVAISYDLIPQELNEAFDPEIPSQE